MIFGYLLLLVALTISAVAAFYSIAGLTAIFAAAFWPIVIMGTVLEFGKIISTVWLHKYWDRAAVQFKLYLIPAICILMLITSMGIFGFLSKAHLDQAVPAGDISAQVQIFDDKIKTERDNIEVARRAQRQMEAQVDAKLARTDDDQGAERAVQIRRSQAKERTKLQNEITAAQKKISLLQEQRAPIASQARKVEAEVGPIKYIAALVYGDNPDAGLLERAVRWVIILIVFVFDPLALVLILAADQTFEWHRPRKPLSIYQEQEQHPGWKQQWIPTTEDPWHDIEPLTGKQLDKIKERSGVDQDKNTSDIRRIFSDGPDTSEFINMEKPPVPTSNVDPDEWLNERHERSEEVEPWHPTELAVPVLEGEETQSQRLIDEAETKNQKLTREVEAIKTTAENLKKKFMTWIKKPNSEN